MNKVICSIAVSVDGFVAGVGPVTEENPFGDMPTGFLHKWMFDEPEKHVEELKEQNSTAGAYIMGRNMFGPEDSTYDLTWQGWWGEEPPYHAPVFVLTHEARDPLVLNGTTFTFITNGIEAALQAARTTGGDKPIAIAGGASTVNQFLTAGLIDELCLHIVPVTAGKGKRLFENVPNLRLEPIRISGTNLVTHIKYQVLHQ